jgi:hypothetical protein
VISVSVALRSYQEFMLSIFTTTLVLGLIRPSFLNFLALQESSQSTRWAVLFSVGVSSLGMVYPVDDKSGRLSGMGGNDDVDEFDC